MGSEMCIRDRPSSVPNCTSKLTLSAKKVAGASLGSQDTVPVLLFCPLTLIITLSLSEVIVVPLENIPKSLPSRLV